MSKHALLMLVCCLVPLALLGVVLYAQVDLGSLGGLLPLAVILLCPLLHILMMRGMGHDHGQHHEGASGQSGGQSGSTPACHTDGRPAPAEPTASRR